MFLVERIVGVATYTILLIIVCNGISVGSKQSMRNWLIFYTVALSVMAFFYVPHQGADLIRLTGYMHGWATMTPTALIEYCSHSNVPVYVAYFWLIGQTGVDGLLTATTCFIYYSLVFSCFWAFYKEYDIQPKYAAWGVALFMSFGVFLEMISGIRSSLAIALSFWCCVREILLGKSPIVHVPLYLAASLIHPLGLFLTLLRFLVLVFQKTENSYKRFAYFIISTIGVASLIVLSPDYISAMVDKGVSYSVGSHYSSAWETVIHAVLILISVSLIVKQRSKLFSHCEDTIVKNLIIMQLVLLAIVFAGFFLDYAIYHRMSTYLGMYSAMVLPLVMKSEEEREGVTTSFIKYVKTGIVVILLLSCARGNLSNYKFFAL